MQELVVIVQLVVLMLDGLNPIEDLEEGFLEDLCMPGKRYRMLTSSLVEMEYTPQVN